ncbi:MAG: hypothetical protein Q4F17_03115 [Eubacteriales bacterium]|nr:hypothetical protein [Eubacteriales bacterium]
MKKEKQVIYYDDPLSDEFSAAQITPRTIDGSWVYVHTSLWKRLTHFFWYRVVAMPIGWVYLKLKFHHKIVGREKLKGAGKKGFFLYGNHTQAMADPFVPTMLAFPRDVCVIVHPNNVSMPYLGRVTPSMGALPLPDDLAASRNFVAAVKHHMERGHGICIYPEAHIWPYYTGIRPFSEKSFGYPIKYGGSVFCFTNTYQKRGKRVQMVTYIDGPFSPKEALPLPQRKRELRDRVFEAMAERAKSSNVEVIEYRRRDSDDQHPVCGE